MVQLNNRTGIVATFVLLMLLVSARTLAIDVVAGQATYDLTGEVSFFQEPKSAGLTLADVRAKAGSVWQSLDEPVFNAGFSDHKYWLKLDLNSLSSAPVRLTFRISQPLQDYIDVWVLRSEMLVEHWTTGDRRPLEQRPVKYRSFAFPLTVPAGQSTNIFLRVDSHDGLHEALPFSLTSPERFMQTRHAETFWYGLYYGAIAILLIYNLVIGFITREREFVLYSVYLGFFLIWNLAFRGFLALGVFANAPALHNASVGLFSVGIFASLVAFTDTFLNLKRNLPRFRYFLWILVGLLSLPTLLALRGDYALVFATLIPVALVIMLSVLGVAAHQTWRGHRSARIFALAWFALIASAFAYYGRVYELVPSTWLTDNALNIGSMIEMLVLSLALASRIGELKEQRLKDQNYIIRREMELKHQLQERVADKTRALQSLAERLEQESITDSLTDLLNRRTFNDTLEDELKNLQRDAPILCLAIIDLDLFKSINDRFGHPTGDAVLAEVAKLIAETWQRPSDYCFRLGGEEFGVVFRGASASANTERLTAFQKALSEMPLPLPDEAEEVCLTASIGVSMVAAASQVDVDDLYASADRALYTSKNEGRNRLTLGWPSQQSA